jgi:urate oxidase
MPDNDILDATDTMQHLIAFQLFQISCSATEAFGKEARESRASSPKIVHADDYSSNTTNNFHSPFPA